jgi:predicted  nucleic acid-binding Zn-ribbon protein
MPDDNLQDDRMQKLMRDLQDGLIVTNAIQARHADLLKDLDHLMDVHNKNLLAHEEMLLSHNKAIRAIRRAVRALAETHERAARETEQYRAKTEQNLLEITEKLNGLIGYMEGQHRPPQ